jgi:hypothetical protein
MKVQTVLYYNGQGKVVAAGAEKPPMDECGVISDDDDFFDVDPLKVERHVTTHSS